ncbi:DNA cytosine methyltransferase [Actinoallomurus vinaceus]|uniref:Cytosine-specific methyltransferase n=1 Tax=Actinoallomurus vinaceus TaxID=1080074 RepID=A0ABP8UJ30_9ACTN
MTGSAVPPAFTIAGLFAGIGGLELGLHAAGGETKLLCEVWGPAKAVLKDKFPDVPLHEDIQTLDKLPKTDVVTAGFPCTDLSQAGRTAGIHGEASGLIKHLFELLRDASPRWVVIENVRNMLVLGKGHAMSYLVEQLEGLGYRWAYRLVDSRFTGVPQRRQRVIMVASKEDDPTNVLFSDDAGEPGDDRFKDDAYGFYWTEGNTGLGWAKDAIPTLKGGSGLGIPSSPAIWIPDAPRGQAIVTPSIEDAEQLQGFPRGWTEAALEVGKPGPRWKLVGNAVTVGVAEWLGRRLTSPGDFDHDYGVPLSPIDKWPKAAWGSSGKRWAVPVSLWPEQHQYTHLLDLVNQEELTPLSFKATAGFHSRLERSSLRTQEAFKIALKEHVEAMRPQTS